MKKSSFKSIFAIALVGLSILACIPLTACNSTAGEVPELTQPTVISYVVNFDSDGGTAVSPQTVTAGGKVKKPVDPVKTSTHTEEYTFIGWYVGDEVWDFESDTVTSDLSLIAKYSVKKSTIQYQ